MAKRRCVRFKKVRGVRRCAKYSGRASTSGGTRRRSSSSTRRRRSATSRRRKPAGMARRGSKCVRFKRVRVRGGGTQRRCAKYRA